MDDKVEPRSPQKMNETNTNFKINIPEINLDELKKQTHLLSASPRARPAMTKSPSARWSCLCSPTMHAGSFRCRHHRTSGVYRGGSVGSNLSDLGRKPGPISDTLKAQ